MNVQKILKWVPSHLGVLVIGAGVVILLLYLPERTTASKLKSELAAQSRQLTSALASIDESRRVADRLDKQIKAAADTIGSLEQRLGKAQSTNARLAKQLDDAQTTVGLLTSGSGQAESNQRGLTKLLIEAQGAVRSAIKITATGSGGK